MDGERQFVEHFMYVFRAPIITWPGYEDLAEGHRQKVTIYRLAGVKEIQEKKAIDYEAMLYISTASFVAPLDHDWVKLYTQLFRKYYGAENADAIGIAEEKIYDNELHQLDRLKSWLYKTQIEFLRPMLRESRENMKKEEEQQTEEVRSKTPTLFDFMGDGFT